MRAVALALVLLSSCHAEIVLNQLFGDNMILQTNADYGARAFFYGTAKPGETVTITGLSRRSATGVPYPTVVASDSTFRVQLDPYQGTEVFNATVTGSVSTNTIKLRHVQYGDVILCSGQSNMNKPLSYVWNATAEIAAATHANVRLFSVAGAAVPNCADPATKAGAACGPQSNFSANGCVLNHAGQTHCAWLPCNPTTVKDFSAVCYLTAKSLMQLNSKLRMRPIGLVQVAVDGTSLEEWTTPAALSECPAHPTAIKDRTSQRFNGMLSPMVGFSIKLVLWYQGEADAGSAAGNKSAACTRGIGGCDFVDVYACRFQAMINHWRDVWGMGDFSFVYAQLAPVPATTKDGSVSSWGLPGPSGGNWPTMRMQQARALPSPGSSVDTSGMAVITDLGDTVGPPHPKNKTEVSRRLALQALHVAYAKQMLANPDPDPKSLVSKPGPKPPQLPYDGFADGPLVRNATLSKNGELSIAFGNAGGISFKPTYDCGLGQYAGTGNGCCSFNRSFEVSAVAAAGSAPADDALWRPVPASAVKIVRGARGAATVVLSIGAAAKAVAVRHAHQMFPQCVIVNANGLVTSPFQLNVSNASSSSSAQRPRRAAPAKGVALTPPLGFNSWNFYHCNIDERAIKQIALTLKSTGLAELGFRYVNIDDCWQVARTTDGTIVPDPARFPSGLKAIADWLHARGMFFGIYTAAHGSTCQGRPGSYLYEKVDSATYCAAGIDYLKIDQCGGDSYEHHHLAKNTSWLRFQGGFAKCLASTGRPIVQSVESCGTVGGCGLWIANCANLWRTGADLEATWSSIMKNLDQTAPLFSLAGVKTINGVKGGHWNDPDMLQVGNVGLTVIESESHMALWCVLAAPLLIGTDLHTASNETIRILGAKELIALDQDALGFQGRVVAEAGKKTSSWTQVYGKKLADGSVGVVMLNRGGSTADLKLTLSDVWLDAAKKYVVRDLWSMQDVGTASGTWTAKAVPSHSHAALRLRLSK